MEKLIENGNVAVLVSHGYGAGLSTWNSGEIAEALAMHKDIVGLVRDGKADEEAVMAILVRDGIVGADDYVCLLGLSDASIEWVAQGSCFEIEEYDGSEGLHIIGERNYFRA